MVTKMPAARGRAGAGAALDPPGVSALEQFQIPPFANEANQQLARELIELQRELRSVHASEQDNTRRADVMDLHMKHVKQEIEQSEHLLEARKRQIQSEEHFKRLAERSSARMQAESERLRGETTETNTRIQSLLNTIHTEIEKISSIKAETHLDEEEYEAWVKVNDEKKDDQAALDRYTQADAAKIRELRQNIELQSVALQRVRDQLVAEALQTETRHAEVSRTYKELQTLHAERKDVIGQWEAILQKFQNREVDIDEAQKTYARLQQDIQERIQAISDKQKFLDEQRAQALALVKATRAGDKDLATTRERANDLRTNMTELQHQMLILKNSVTKTATDLATQRQRNQQTVAETEAKLQQLKKQQQQEQTLNEKLARLGENNMSMEAREQELRDIYQLEERRSKALDREMNMTRNAGFKIKQNVFELEQSVVNLRAELVGSQTASRNLSSQINRMIQDGMRQKTLLYTQEFHLEQLERKIRRATGDRTEEERIKLEAKIVETNSALEAQNARWTQLTTQIRKSQDGLRADQKAYAVLKTEQAKLGTQLQELMLYNDNSVIKADAKRKEKEDLMIEETLLKLELKKRSGWLSTCADQVYSLEARQLELQASVEMRGREIEVHNDLLRMQLKTTEEERHSASAELRDRQGRVDRLRKRYEVLMSCWTGQVQGEEHSQAYYVIRAAQEKEELVKQGNELDAEIGKAERAVKAMQNTLGYMGEHNAHYEGVLHTIQLNSQDVQYKAMLDTQIHKAILFYREKKEQLELSHLQLQQLELRFAEMNREEAEKLAVVQALKHQIATLDHEIHAQREKEARARKTLRKLVLAHRKAADADYTPEEEDFAIRQLREVINLVLHEILTAAGEMDGLLERVQILFEEHGVQAPSALPSALTSRAASVLTSRAGSRTASPVPSQPASEASSRSVSRTASRPPSRLALNRGTHVPVASGAAAATAHVTLLAFDRPASPSASSTASAAGGGAGGMARSTGGASGSVTPSRRTSGRTTPVGRSRSQLAAGVRHAAAAGRASPGLAAARTPLSPSPVLATTTTTLQLDGSSKGLALPPLPAKPPAPSSSRHF
ncbi:hypothetical protein CXG81DRAFT_24753 [Caulochytrium protostelioides]|uniref:Coiled-coil domain-containing protein 39 n=1 Tax=Caulochytrium protostelioides TaxID=1555241 RepID=A0A4P9XBW6_9FUNG|nr:hypothetical protein CXG81DRAFT_24753 [Caulochytrium protostelioides]|eukprot:RKP02611.1 hypothetical protein CXG81DRAFT_24753 [Caulochytrium protostelioides]